MASIKDSAYQRITCRDLKRNSDTDEVNLYFPPLGKVDRSKTWELCKATLDVKAVRFRLWLLPNLTEVVSTLRRFAPVGVLKSTRNKASTKNTLKEKGKKTMTNVKASTKKGQEIINDFYRAVSNHKTIYTAYNNASYAKQNAWNEIKARAKDTEGYENNLSIVGASSHFFSCIYSYVQDGIRYIVKDTHSNTFIVAMD